MLTKNLYVGKLINAINQFVDDENDILDWGEWMVGYAVDCAMAKTKPNYQEKLMGIAGIDFAQIILEEHTVDFKRIELAVETQRGEFFDYKVDHLGVIFIGH